MVDYADRAQKLIGQRGILVPWSWAGVYNQAASLRDPQELLVDAYEEPERYEALMEFLTDKTIEYTLRLAQTAVDAVGLQGNMANGAMMGKTFFDEWILPYEARLVAAVHSCGRPVVYHNCGCARNLLPSYVEMELDAWETVAQAPQGDNDLRAAKEQVGEKLILIGNIDQVHFLKTASEAEVRERTAEIVQIGKTGGNYIFAASDFLEKGTPVENIRASIAAAKEAGKY